MNYCSKMERHWNASAQTQIAVLEYVLKLASADPFMGPGIPEFTPKDEGLQRALPDPCKESKHVQDLGPLSRPFQKHATIEGLEGGDT